MLAEVHSSGDEEYYFSRAARPCDIDPWALPKMSDDEAAPAAPTGDATMADTAPEPMLILRDHPSQLTLFQEIAVRAKFKDPKTGKDKTMTKKQRVLRQGPPFSKPHKGSHFMPEEWPVGKRFDASDLTITANVDGSEMKHFPWVPGMTEQHEQLVKFNQHIRKESGLNKDTQFADQGKWKAKLPGGAAIELPYWPENAFHVRKKRTKGDEGGASSMDNGVHASPPPAKKAKVSPEGATTGRVPPAAAAGKATAPPGLVAKGAAHKPPTPPSGGCEAEKALLTKLFNGSDEELKHIAMACLTDMHAPCGPVKTNTPWTCTGEFEPKTVAEIKEFLETTDECDASGIDKITRDLESFRKVFKMFFGGLPVGWMPQPAQPPPKKRMLCID